MRRLQYLVIASVVAMAMLAGLLIGAHEAQPQVVYADGASPGVTVRQAPLYPTTADVHTPGISNTAAIVTYTAPSLAYRRNCIAGVTFSYDSAPTGGELSILDDTGTIWHAYVTSGGPGPIAFQPGICGAQGDVLTVTLGAAGSGVTGTLSVHGHWTE